MNGKPKTYIINFVATDAADVKVNLWQLTRYLHDSRDIIAYWNYIPLVYCIKSYLSADELTVKLRPFFPNSYMIAEIDPGNINGILPKEAWTWFYMDHHEKQELPTSLGTDLLSLYGGIPGQLLPPLPFPRKKD
jgi:hypothetical protein